MFKVLLKKQFAELLETYTPKKLRGKGKRSVGYLVLYVFLYLMLGVSFGSMLFELCKGLVAIEVVDLRWFYFLLVFIMSLMIGVLGSVFSAYSTIYRAKDNESLLAMPIPPLTLMAARMVAVYVTGLAFDLLALLPGTIVYFLAAGFSFGILCASLFSALCTSMIVLALICFFGWIIALVSSFTRNKSIVTVLISLALLAVYYVICFNMSSLVQKLIENAVSYGNSLSARAYILKLFGLSFTGDPKGMLALFACSAGFLMLTLIVMTKSFTRIISTQKGTKRKVYTEKKLKNSGVNGALLKKELRHFTQSPSYMLNCGLGLAMLLCALVYLAIQFKAFHGTLSAFLTPFTQAKADGGGDGVWYGLICFAPAALPAFITCLNPISAPSISLEGHSIWILRSLPVDTKRVLTVKQLMHLILCLPLALIATAMLCALIDAPALAYVTNLLFTVFSGLFISALGLTLGLKKPNLDWTNEAVPVKQGMAVAITLFAGMALPIVTGLLAFLLRNIFDVTPFLWLLPAVGALLLNRWIYTRGVEKFEELN